MQFKISKELLEQIEQLIYQKNDRELEVLLNDFHHADIAEVLEELDFDEATYIFKLLDSDNLLKILSLRFSSISNKTSADLSLSNNLKEDTIFDLRPEQLTVEQFIELTQKIEANAV